MPSFDQETLDRWRREHVAEALAARSPGEWELQTLRAALAEGDDREERLEAELREVRALNRRLRRKLARRM